MQIEIALESHVKALQTQVSGLNDQVAILRAEVARVNGERVAESALRAKAEESYGQMVRLARNLETKGAEDEGEALVRGYDGWL